MNELHESLRMLGSDLSGWPPEAASRARQRLLSDPEFRRAWERERDLDRMLAAQRDELDRSIQRSGALERVRSGALARLPNALAGFRWQRVAAAVLVAGMLGGALDLVLPEPPADAPEIVMLDPLYGIEETELQ
jgi:hypothetical protein